MDSSIEKYRILKKYFGYDSFRNGQEEIIDSIICGSDVLCIMPTGAGKSMCYQIPSLLLPGITLVISPLISLMHDQVMSLVQSGFPAAYINSSLTAGQYFKAIERMRSGFYKLVYVSPERLESDRFLSLCRELPISLVAVDESHCVSQWGQDFRPSYLHIRDFVSSLPIRPTVGAFTATATLRVRDDIVRLLSLSEPKIVTTGFDRPNLFFSVRTPETKWLTLIDMIRERSTLSGIVYCTSRLTVEKLCEIINENGIPAARYHAGLSDSERMSSQEDFLCDRVRVMVATNAFGMGIDKPNVSYVIHYNMPADLESYYQEAGRAGRDGAEAECILLFAERDINTIKYFIDNSVPSEELNDDDIRELRKRGEQRLYKMIGYSRTSGCLREYMLRYFGEKFKGPCNKCSCCRTSYMVADITEDARKILSCAIRLKKRCTSDNLIKVLRGERDSGISENGFDMLSTYGIMSNCTERRIKTEIEFLTEQGFLLSDSLGGGLTVTPKAAPVLKGSLCVRAGVPEDPLDGGISSNADTVLLDKLKRLRSKLAQRASIPDFSVLTDKALEEICINQPDSYKKFSLLKGVGRLKADKYAEVFIEEIRQYKNENGK